MAEGIYVRCATCGGALRPVSAMFELREFREGHFERVERFCESCWLGRVASRRGIREKRRGRI
jgi:hypothetical protein